MLKGMQHHYTKGFLYSVIKFEWSSYTQLSAHYSATTGSLFRTCGSIHSQYSKDSDYTIELANISLFTEKEQELFNVTDISLTSTTKDIEKKESFKLTLKPQERKKIYLGYVLLDSEYDSLKDNLYILPDLNGVVAMDPQYLTKVKLDIKEN